MSQSNTYAPIVLFVYNRPEHTQKTIEALAQNSLAAESDLYIFSDGPKTNSDAIKIAEVRNLIKEKYPFKKVIIKEAESNKGLANSVIEGVSSVLSSNNKVIVLEDDIITHPSFLQFMNSALDAYKNDHSIISASGYHPPVNIPEEYPHNVYLSYRASSWGWGTWKNRWEKVDWSNEMYQPLRSSLSIQKLFNRGGADLSPMLKKQLMGKIDSWAIRWNFFHFLNEGYSIQPTQTLLENIGLDGSGTHKSRKMKNDRDARKFSLDLELPDHIEVEKPIIKSIQKKMNPSVFRKIIDFINLDLKYYLSKS